MGSFVIGIPDGLLQHGPGKDDELAKHKWAKAYEERVKAATSNVSGHFCFPVDWFPEPRPVENRFGSCMVDHIAGIADPGACLEGIPAPLTQDLTEAPGISVLVFPDSYGYCKGIVEYAPFPVDKKKVVTKDPSSLSLNDIKKLLADDWDYIIFASGVDTAESNSASKIIQHQDGVTKLFMYLLQEIVARPECTRGLVVLTVDTFAEEREIHEECGVSIVTGSQLFGMCNTARIELPDTPIHYIETEWALPDHMMRNLSSEVFRIETLGVDSVRILQTGRYVLRRVSSKPYEAAARSEFQMPPSGSVIGISGGNGALALVMGEFLLDKAEEQNATGLSIKFLSRSCRISDEAGQKTWERIQARAGKLGIEVEQAKCDVSSKDEVRKFVQDHSPKLGGFIHSAGVLTDALISNQTWEKFERCFGPKSHAALHLHEALLQNNNPDLKFFWMFSSTSVYGNAGQVNYGGSNAVQDALARHRRALGLPCMVVQWGAWGEVGMAANLDAAAKRRFEKSPAPPHTNAEGIAGLECGLRSGVPYYAVYKINAPVMMGMVGHVTNVAHAYARNFESNLFPLPYTENPQQHQNDYVRALTGGTAKLPVHDSLVYKQFCADEDDE